MTPGELNSLHKEYRQRLPDELRRILLSASFCEIGFLHQTAVDNFDRGQRFGALSGLFGAHLEQLALCLGRVWEEPTRSPEKTVSLPCLVEVHHAHNYLGCLGLAVGRPKRALFDSLRGDPILHNVRILRTEALAHAVVVGTSGDRRRLGIPGQRSFDLTNGEITAFARKTGELLVAVIEEVCLLGRTPGTTLDEMWLQAEQQSRRLWHALVNA